MGNFASVVGQWICIISAWWIIMSAEEKSTWLEYQTKLDERLFVRTFRTDARLPALWLSTLVYRRMPKQWCGVVSVGGDGRTSSYPAWKSWIGKEEQLLKKSSGILYEGNRLVEYRFLDGISRSSDWNGAHCCQRIQALYHDSHGAWGTVKWRRSCK